MPTKTDISYGVIPLRQNEQGEWEVLVIHQYSHRADDAYWTFPKGHPEGNETPQQTATRELWEETSLQVAEIILNRTFENSYTFTLDDTIIDKTAVFYVATVQPGEVTLQEEEVREAVWLPLAEVADKLDYQATKDMWQEVLNFV